MKKVLFSMAAVAMLATACNKVTDESAQNAIKFDGGFVHNNVQTATVSEITTENLAEFFVYGGYDNMTHVFNNTAVTKGGGSWTYSPDRFWVDGKTYHFAAYAPSAAGSLVQVDGENNALTFKDYVSNPTTQHDLIYATANHTAAASGNAKIKFNFSHLLSMIKFTFKSGFGEQVTINISDLKVYGMGTKDTYQNGSWSGAPTEALTDAAPFNEMYESDIQNNSDAATSHGFVVIPQTANLQVSFNVQVTDVKGTEIANKTFTTSISSATWTAGMRYNYVATITGESLQLQKIEFDDPDVAPWTNETPDPTLPLN